MGASTQRISVVIPTFNEDENLAWNYCPRATETFRECRPDVVPSMVSKIHVIGAEWVGKPLGDFDYCRPIDVLVIRLTHHRWRYYQRRIRGEVAELLNGSAESILA